MKMLTIGLSAVALASAGVALADHHGGGMRHNPDADGDGIVTQAEAKANAAQMFAMMDANSDGKLDEADWKARQEKRREHMFAKLDSNSDGNISREEFMTFEHRGMRGKEGRMGHRRGDHPGMMAKMADTNNDGAVSQAEFTAAALKHFEKMDANGDGEVTKAERDAAKAEMRSHWRKERRGDVDG